MNEFRLGIWRKVIATFENRGNSKFWVFTEHALKQKNNDPVQRTYNSKAYVSSKQLLLCTFVRQYDLVEVGARNIPAIVDAWHFSVNDLAITDRVRRW